MTGQLRSVITGGPGAGKSTLLDELSNKGLPVFDEAARAILQEEGGMAMRVDRPNAFARTMLAKELEAYHAGERHQVSIYDRGFPDIVGFCDLEGMAVSAELDRCCKTFRYSGPVFRAPPWQEIYMPDAERIQNWSEAIESDKAVCSAWARYGYQLIDLPFSPVVERAEFVARFLGVMTHDY